MSLLSCQGRSWISSITRAPWCRGPSQPPNSDHHTWSLLRVFMHHCEDLLLADVQANLCSMPVTMLPPRFMHHTTALQAQHQQQKVSTEGGMSDATRTLADMAEDARDASQPASPPSLTSEGPLPPPGTTRSPPRGPPPAQRMLPEHEVSLRISGAVAGAMYGSGHSQLRRIATILPEGWQLMPGLLLTARRLTSADHTLPNLLELADHPPEAGNTAHAETGATHVPEEELTDLMLELFEEGSLTELLEDDVALQTAIQSSTRRSGRTETSETSEAPIRAMAKAKAKSEATSGSSTSRKPETHFLYCVACAFATTFKVGAYTSTFAERLSCTRPGDPWSPPCTETPLGRSETAHWAAHILMIQGPTSYLWSLCCAVLQARRDRLSSATNARAQSGATRAVQVKIGACTLPEIIHPPALASMSGAARYPRPSLRWMWPGSCLPEILCALTTWLLHLTCEFRSKIGELFRLILTILPLHLLSNQFPSSVLRYRLYQSASTTSPRRPTTSPTSLFRNRSCPGPNSRGYSHTTPRRCTIMLILLCQLVQTARATVADARVRFPPHPGNLEANHRQTLFNIRAKPSGDCCHPSRPSDTTQPVRKRAFRRALQRARLSDSQSTMYRGRKLYAWATPHGESKSQVVNTTASRPAHSRLQIVCWNAGGLAGHKYQEVLTWLQLEHEANRTVDICVLVETCWQDYLEYTTTFQAPNSVNWHVVHSTGKDRTGVLCMIRSSLISAERIRTAELLPGRLLHLRLMFQAPLDILCTYQHAWNLQNKALRGPDKTAAMLKLRRRVWDHLDTWLTSIPNSHGCMILGDLNQSVLTDPPVSGPGLPAQNSTPHPDQSALMDILKAHQCCVLNTWSRSGPSSRTFLSPGADRHQLGTQIDFVIARGMLIDNVSKQAGPFDAPFVPVSGCRHRPLRASMPAPRRPQRDMSRKGPPPRQVQRLLRQPDLAQHILQWIAPTLQQASAHQSIDAILLEGWSQAQEAQHPRPHQVGSGIQRDYSGTLTNQVRGMWLLRRHLQTTGQALWKWSRRGVDTRALLQAWFLTTKLQAHTRALRQACRQKKINAVAEVVQSSDIYAAAQRFAPKAPRRRLQLRKADGRLQTHEEEFQQITDHFRTLYDGPEVNAPSLPEDINITAEEIQAALHRLRPGKAMPSDSAPAALWKLSGLEVIQPLRRHFAHHLRRHCQSLPQAWNICELVLLPKPHKPLKSPAHLRPICLLSLPAKILASVVASRLQPFVTSFLDSQPQYAYVQGRTLAQALERVLSHCATVRALVQQQATTLHARREGGAPLKIYGGCQLSLDISSAYDHVPRWALEAALREAQVPESLIQLVLLIHQQALVRVRHFQQETMIQLRRGLRQGCGLAPLLWALYSGWLLRRMDHPDILSVPRAATVYADDQHYSWLIRSSSDLENAYKAIRHVLQQLRQHGLCISVDKTVILLELKGSLATKLSARYVVHTEQGPHMKFVIDGHTLLIKLVPQHTYLGAIISYHKFESATFKHRLGVAKSAFTRLRVILHNRSVPLMLRLRLWQGCIWPAILHGLDCAGLSPTDFQALQSQLIKQARSIAKSFSMLTRESNYDFLKRLKIDDPVRRLRNAVRRRYQQDDRLGPGLIPGPEQMQWRALVSSMLFDTPSMWQTQTKPTHRTQLVCVQNVLNEVFPCLECGQQFVTAAALKRHMYCMHMDQQQQEVRGKATQQARKHSAMEHSHQGMPQCRHCMYKFSTWHAFFHHVSEKCCTALREIYQAANPEVSVLPQLSEALADSQDIIDLARDCTWQTLAALPQVRAKHHHCLECNHWSVRPQYVRRHMHAKHPERDALVQECIADIKKSNISIQNPCQFCGQGNSRRDAHLRSCVGIFNGVYLHRRLARGRHLDLAGSSTHGGGPSVVDHVRDVRRGDLSSHRAPGGHPGTGCTEGTPPIPAPVLCHGPGGTGGRSKATEVAQAGPQRCTRRRQGQTAAPTERGPLWQLMERQRLAQSKPTGTVGVGAQATPVDLQAGGDPGPAAVQAPGHSSPC